MRTFQETFGWRLKALRAKRDYTQTDLAGKSRLTLGYIARLEIGYHDPKLSTLMKLAKALGVKVAELVE